MKKRKNLTKEEKKERLFKRLVIIMLLVIIFEIPALLTGLHIHSINRREYVNEEIQSRITDEVMKANVIVAPTTIEKKDEKTVRNYYIGASGFIFKKEENKYYVLTCFHVVDGEEDGTLVIVPDTIEKYENISSQFDDHKSYPIATLEYISPDTDMAILSFVSEEEWPVLKISDQTLKKGQSLVVIGNPSPQIGVIHYGEITSSKTHMFKCRDNRPATPVLYHNVYTKGGSSGSAVLNEDLEVVGINIGGNLSSNKEMFVYGAFVPATYIKQTINNWQKNR